MEKISFYSGGHKLSGYIRIPKTGNKKSPGIVCCHGYGGYWDLETVMQDIAERLTEAGYVTLVFYHRGLGESEGPKGRVIPHEQAEDIWNAITYLQTRTEVDPNKIGLYGTSFGGANVVYVGGMDSRAKCVVSTVGIGDCERWLKGLRQNWEWVEFLKTIEEDRTNRVLTGNSRYVDHHEIMLPPSKISKNDEDSKLRKEYRQKWGLKGYTLESAEAALYYKPELVVDRISPRAVLFIYAGNDQLCSPEETLSMYEKAKEPKRIVNMEGHVHYEVYKFKNPTVFEKVMATAIDWYKEYLPIE